MRKNVKARTKREPQREPDANHTPLTRGVRTIDRPNRPNPYGCQWRERVFDAAAGDYVVKVRTQFFSSKTARDSFAGLRAKERRSGMARELLTREETEEYRAIKAAFGGVPWQVVLAGYHENQQRTGRAVCTVTVEKAVADYLAEALALRDAVPPKLSGDTYRQKYHKLTLFAEQFGGLLLDQVKSNEVESWIDDFDEVATDVTFDNYRKHVRALYGWAIEKKLVGANPAADVKRRGDGPAEIKFLSVAQTARLFHTALTYEQDGHRPFLRIVGRLALEAFIGLRFSSGCRIEKSDINFADRGILLPRRKLKTGMVAGGRGHYIDNLPEQVWAWLAIAPAETWVVKPRDYMGLKSQLFHVAGVPHPHNCLRHAFCSYDIAAHKNPGRTATILCHRDQELLWRHYFGTKTVEGELVTQEMGRRYQSITPATAAQLAQP